MYHLLLLQLPSFAGFFCSSRFTSCKKKTKQTWHPVSLPSHPSPSYHVSMFSPCRGGIFLLLHFHLRHLSRLQNGVFLEQYPQVEYNDRRYRRSIVVEPTWKRHDENQSSQKSSQILDWSKNCLCKPPVIVIHGKKKSTLPSILQMYTSNENSCDFQHRKTRLFQKFHCFFSSITIGASREKMEGKANGPRSTTPSTTSTTKKCPPKVPLASLGRPRSWALRSFEVFFEVL